MGRIIAKRLRGMNWMAKVSLILIFTVIFCIIALSGFGTQQTEAATLYSRVTGTWATVGTWSAASCGGVSSGTVPAAGDTVTICTGNTVTLGAIPANVLNQTIQTGATLAGAGFLQTLTGNYTNNGTHSGTGGATLSGAAMTIDGTGSITNTGTFTISGTKTIASTANLTFAGIVTCSAAVTNNGIVTITNTGAGSLAGASSWTQGANSTLNYAGSTITITTFTPTGAGNTVKYSAAGVQTVMDVAYVNLTTSGSGTKTWTLTAARVVGGIITVGSGTNLTTAGNFTLGVTGATNVTGTLTLGGTSGKTFTGDVTLNAGSVWNETGISTYAIAGNFTNNATTFTASTGVHTFSGATKTLSGSTAIVIPSAAFTGTYTNNGTLTVGTALSGAGGLTQGTNDVLNIGGTSTITTLTATASGNTVNYNGAVQTVKGTTYVNLTLSGTGAKTTATVTVTGILSMEGTAAVTASAVPTYGAAATLQYNKTAAFTSGVEWPAAFAGTGGVIIKNAAGVITIGTAAKVLSAGGVTIDTGATLDASASNYNLTVGGNWSNSGTFTARSATVLFNGTGNQSISGSNTWYNLSITTAATARTVKFASGATQTIAAGGSLNLQGFSATQLLTLAPTVNGSAWLLNKNAAITPTISNVSVSFSNAGSGGLIDASTGANNSNAGNNTNWKFTATIVSCVGCHGYKATFGDGTARNTPDGQFQGSHNEHVVTYSKTCSVCHTVPAGETSAYFNHRNGTVQIAATLDSSGTNAGTYSRPSFPQANSFAPGTCSNTYCHSNGTSATVPAGSIPNNTTTTWGGTTACNGCHAVGGAADGRPFYAGGSPKANAHQAATHLSKTCDICHNSVTYSAGVYTPNTTLHVNVAYNINSGMTYTPGTAALGGTCATPGSSCHGSVNWGGTVDCISCHVNAQDDGIAPTRRAITAEFGMAWSHKRTASTSATYPTAAGVAKKYDCCVCHMEGTAATGAVNPTYHKNNAVDLRDPDLGTAITGFASFTRNTASATLEAWVTNVQSQLCLKCHDVNGANSALARVPGGTAARPFGTAPTHTPGTNVLDVDAHFAIGNATFHPIKGAQNNSYANSTTMVAPWGVVKTPGTLQTNGLLISCWDCHPALNTAHGGTLTLRAVYPAYAASATSTTTVNNSTGTLCSLCHQDAVYTTGASAGNSAFGDTAQGAQIHGNSGRMPWTCNHCHGSSWADPGRPTRAQDAHGFNSFTAGGSAAGGATWLNGTKPYAFQRNDKAKGTGTDGRWENWRPRKDGATTNATWGCAWTVASGGGACGRSDHTTAYMSYLPGGVF
ncbi:MAG: CxxxxCH/CxxCH domain-containing protein [Dehalococcoidia bacterium]